jgi:Protein of unknown function (DUF3626)
MTEIQRYGVSSDVPARLSPGREFWRSVPALLFWTMCDFARTTGRPTSSPGCVQVWNGSLPTSGIDQEAAAGRALAHVAGLARSGPGDPEWRVTLNFHPDRWIRGQPILAALLADGVYVSQFVTGTGNGGLTAHPGGDRWRWESRIFGGAYDDAPAHERPVYGALNFRRKAIGGAARFGSAHLRLAVDVLRKHPDYRGPRYVDLGTRLAVDGVLTPRVIGAAVGQHDEQDLKRVWHYLARFGTVNCDSGEHGAADSGACGRGLG